MAAIFGQGNVAIDVSRILLSPIDELRVRIAKYKFIVLFNFMYFRKPTLLNMLWKHFHNQKLKKSTS